MARYTGPVCRLCRRQGEKLMLKGERCLSPKCALEKRRMPPGQHRVSRRRLSEYGIQLKEKQKVRYIYGVLERQFRKYFAEANRLPGLSGENLLRLLEMRLDNVVYRLGFAGARRQARQLVRHGHITINGRKVDIPSCQVRPGDVIAWRGKSTELDVYQKAEEEAKMRSIPGWLGLDLETLSGRVLAPPALSDIDAAINERLIVGYYSR